ncbi:MAG: flagellar filament capping protein FliD [Phycisphaerae bacterium]|nr:flagellar filament capping protein FliD [Phycisphaerae bacterium]
MAGFSTAVGLVSGLPTAELIDGFMQIERRPINLLESRVAAIQTKRTAWAELTARLLSVKTMVARFNKSAFFRHFNTTSSDENVLSATAGEHATAGTYQFVVHSLVGNHQLIGKGLHDTDTTPVGAGTLTLEIGHGKVNPGTTLDQLNGGQGVHRGSIRITDRTGVAADIDLSRAIMLDDLVEQINTQASINVEARINGDCIILEDLNSPGSVVGNLSVVDLAGGAMAASLGLAQSVAGNTITGKDLVHLTDSTPLDLLNDGNGIRRHIAGYDFRITQGFLHSFDVSLAADLAKNPQTSLAQLNNGQGVRLGTIRITDQSGATAEIDLSAATTVQDVLDAINNSGIGVSAIVGRDYIQLNDTTATPDDDDVNLKIEDVTGYAARDLGIAVDTDTGSHVGSEIFRITTIGDVIRAINYAPGNDTPGQQVVASISADGNGIVLTDESSGGTAPLTIEAMELNGVVSSAAADLGILGEFASGSTTRRDLIAGPDSVLLSSLNGGRGITTKGAVEFIARDGTLTEIDFSTAQTLQGVLDLINTTSETSKISASINNAGNGIEITDLSGGSGNLLITDLADGTIAEGLGIAGAQAASTLNGGNLQLRYVSENTRLEDLNYGSGIRPGSFKITDSAGVVTTVKVGDQQKTLDDIINLINSGAATVTARINDTGDGLLITDDAGGDKQLSIVDLEGGFAAADLNILGEAADGTTSVDGSYEITIEVDADDTLNDVVAKIGDATKHVEAGVLNAGGVNGYRLTLSSLVGGLDGELVFDSGGTGLAMDTLVRAQDAVVFLGGASGNESLVITSSTNTLTNVIGDVTIDLVGTSDDPITLSISQNVDNVVSDVELFVTNFNAVLDRIDEYTMFNPETLERGILLGDSTVRRIQSRLNRSTTHRYENVPAAHSRMFSIGLTVGSGGRLQFDESEFRKAYDNDPESVELFFNTAETGLGSYLEEMFDDLTRGEDGLVSQAEDVLANSEQLLRDRIDTLETLLDKKRTRLERQFLALEESLAKMQDQQNALMPLLSQMQW